MKVSGSHGNDINKCPLTQNDCMEDECQWWSEGNCAVVILASGVNYFAKKDREFVENQIALKNAVTGIKY